MDINIDELGGANGILLFEHKQSGDLIALELNSTFEKFVVIATALCIGLFFGGFVPVGIAGFPTLFWLMSKKLWSKFFLFLFIIIPAISMIAFGLSFAQTHILEIQKPDTVIVMALAYFFMIPSMMSLFYIYEYCVKNINPWLIYKYLKRGYRIVSFDQESKSKNEAISKIFVKTNVE